MKIEMTGVLSSRRAMENLGDELTKRLNDEIARAAKNVANHARFSIQDPNKSGRLYPRGGKMHQASQEGEAPAFDTGRLAGSITQERSQTAAGRLATWITGSKLNYSKWLEFGTMRMGERPFLRPALRKERAEFMKRVANLPGSSKVRLNALMKEE